MWALSQDVFKYPDSVNINEIDGRSFNVFWRNGSIGPGLDIGQKGCFGHRFPTPFADVKAVLGRYDEIREFVDTLTLPPPDVYHDRCQDGGEVIVAVRDRGRKDVDPLHFLFEAGNLESFSEGLPWWKDPPGKDPANHKQATPQAPIRRP